MKIKDFSIYTTYSCNMSCSFCFCRDKMSQGIGSGSAKERLIKLQTVIETNECESFVFTGGEPLLDLEFLLPAIQLIRKSHQDIHIGVNTNGSLLTPNLVSFFNFYKVTLKISFSGYTIGEKSLLYSQKLNNNAYDLLSLIHQVKSKVFVIVVSPSKPFASGVVELLQKTNFTNLQINLDALSKFNITDLLFIEKELMSINRELPNIHKTTSFLLAIEHCESSTCFGFDPTGKFECYPCIKKEGWDGCPDLVDILDSSLDNTKYLIQLQERNRKGLL